MLAARAELGNTPIAVLDTETTGIYPGGHDRIIEIALLRFRPDTGQVEDEYATLINPKRDIGRADIHGIAAVALANKPARIAWAVWKHGGAFESLPNAA